MTGVVVAFAIVTLVATFAHITGSAATPDGAPVDTAHAQPFNYSPAQFEFKPAPAGAPVYEYH